MFKGGKPRSWHCKKGSCECDKYFLSNIKWWPSLSSISNGVGYDDRSAALSSDPQTLSEQNITSSTHSNSGTSHILPSFTSKLLFKIRLCQLFR